jgi:hypothetical protein
MGRRNALEANRKSESVSIKPFIWGTPEQACPQNYLPISFGYLLRLAIRQFLLAPSIKFTDGAQSVQNENHQPPSLRGRTKVPRTSSRQPIASVRIH